MEEIIMLIFQRHPGESFWIDKNIQVIILGHFNGITHVGIESPAEIKIIRDELKNSELFHEHK
jgi:carbon storage regulator CsrA